MKLITFNWCTRRIMEMKNATNFENLFPFSLNPRRPPVPPSWGRISGSLFVRRVLKVMLAIKILNCVVKVASKVA